MPELSEQTVYADDHLVVLDKPAGLLCVPGRGADKQDCLASRVQQHYPDAMIVHRLDMATSGLCVMARGAEMQRRLSRAFAEREVGKRYIAVVAGILAGPDPDEWALIDLPIAADWPNRPLRVIDTVHGKPSQTKWRVLPPEGQPPSPPSPKGGRSQSPLPPLPGEGWGGGCTRLELQPLTGRTHQLRVHLQALGHPILGDTLYAPPEVQAGAPRLLLHAAGLDFRHPATGVPLAFSSPAPF